MSTKGCDCGKVQGERDKIMALNKKTIDKIDVKGKRVLMRYYDIRLNLS